MLLKYVTGDLQQQDEDVELEATKHLRSSTKH